MASEEARAAGASLEVRRQDLQRKLAVRVTSMLSLAASMESSLPDLARSIKQYCAGMEAAAAKVLVDPLLQSVPVDLDAALAPITEESSSKSLAAVDAVARTLPSLTDAQQAWDELTAVQGAQLEVRRAKQREKRAERLSVELTILAKQFVASRDGVLTATYGAITKELTGLYRKLHGEDESAFKADLSPTRAGVKLEVDFHGRGSHPPSALHSEGHQDSMGVCLFLALAEHLAAGATPLIILDDVLMSVDHGHRRRMADLLRDRFPDIQFLITTHDAIWYRQLRNLGVVKSDQCVEISGWSIETGPHFVGEATAVLAQAEQALGAGNVRSSAHLLRSSVESHFREICDGLAAELRYHGDDEYGAGEFLIGANKRLKEIVGLAKKAAVSWGSDTGAIDEYEKSRATASKGFHEENWAVNVNVHFNEWAQFDPADFRPVLTAYQTLFALFVCVKCETPYRVTHEGVKPIGFRCTCGQINWNLLKK